MNSWNAEVVTLVIVIRRRQDIQAQDHKQPRLITSS